MNTCGIKSIWSYFFSCFSAITLLCFMGVPSVGYSFVTGNGCATLFGSDFTRDTGRPSSSQENSGRATALANLMKSGSWSEAINFAEQAYKDSCDSKCKAGEAKLERNWVSNLKRCIYKCECQCGCSYNWQDGSKTCSKDENKNDTDSNRDTACSLMHQEKF